MKSKTRLNLSLIVLMLTSAVFASLLFGETSADKKEAKHATTFMRKKLVYSQNVLEGLTLENYDQIVTNGMKMWNMGKSNLWQVLFAEDYQKQSATYRGHVMAMVEAARAQKLEAAREAYVKSLQSCYDCHKHFKVEQRARLQKPKEGK